jgi:acyl-CoA thioester hydrolase
MIPEIRTELRADPNTGCWVALTRVRVRYSEIDRMGFAYNAHYLTWFEIGRSEFMRGKGLSYREIEERGYHLPLVQAALTLRLPVRYDDVLTVETRIAKLRSRTVTFGYQLIRDDRTHAEGTTRHACLLAESGRAVTMPAWLSEGLAALP